MFTEKTSSWKQTLAVRDPADQKNGTSRRVLERRYTCAESNPSNHSLVTTDPTTQRNRVEGASYETTSIGRKDASRNRDESMCKSFRILYRDICCMLIQWSGYLPRLQGNASRGQKSRQGCVALPHLITAGFGRS